MDPGIIKRENLKEDYAGNRIITIDQSRSDLRYFVETHENMELYRISGKTRLETVTNAPNMSVPVELIMIYQGASEKLYSEVKDFCNTQNKGNVPLNLFSEKLIEFNKEHFQKADMSLELEEE